MSEKKKIDGLIVKKNEKSPEWVLTSVSLEVESFKKWLDENKNAKGWVNLDLKKAKDGRFYLDHNDYKPKESVPF
jgi:hypothetical protein